MTEVLRAPGRLTGGAVFESSSLFLDFERELEALLNPRYGPRSRRSSQVGPGSGTVAIPTPETDYEGDGTVLCSNLDHNVLCNLAGTQDLSELKSLSLCISCRTSFDNLAILARFMPNLTTLKLDHSKFASMRTLGDELSRLTTLSVCDCGLQDLDGITAAPNLLHLVAANNEIEELLPMTELRKLVTLDLENNSVNTFDSVSFLFLCPKLETLVLKTNPVAEEPDYRSRIFSILPELKNLDVILFPRVHPDLCRRFRRLPNPDDDNPGGNPMELKGEVDPGMETLDPCAHHIEGAKELQMTYEILGPDVPTEEAHPPERVPAAGSWSQRKLLERRQSQDPLRLASIQEAMDPDQDDTPNLQSFMGAPRSDSPMDQLSLASLVTLSGSDSGIDSSRHSSDQDKEPSKSRGKSPAMLPVNAEIGSRSLLHQGAEEVKTQDLSRGTRRTEGDIEIEEFDD